MMDKLSQLALTLTQEEIIQDLQPVFIAQDLVDYGVIDGMQQSKILSEASEELQARMLLKELITNGGPEALNLFMKSLQNDEKYSWLADALKEKRDMLEKDFNEFNDLLTKGGVPHLPPHMLTRIDLQKHTRESLEAVFRQGNSGYVTIHGMGGSGKSTLAAASVRDFKFICDLFPQGVYWMKIGKNINDDSLLIKMHTLCEKLDSSYRESIPCSLEMAIDRLRILFTSTLYRKSLLILDDVWDDSTIRHFDFGCRILLTTRIKSVMDVTCRKVLYIEIRDGFSLPECLQFFADSIKRKISDLPKDLIKKIHELTEGSPMVMSIISSSVRSVSDHNRDGAFQNCLKKLEDNSFIKNKKKTPYEYPCIAQALEMSITSLEEDQLEYYYDLAIFPSEFDIIGKVLAIFWKKDLFEVVEIMTAFIEKSVATQVSNGHSNLYTIHDLYLRYLKDYLKDSLMSRHKRLITCYLEKCKYKYENLPDDGYILRFLGHHLKGANMLNAFPQVFLDLKVLIPKLKATGPADLLGDFDRYEDLITQNGKFVKKLQDFREFISSNAHLLTNTLYDIRQVALCQPSSSDVFQQAKKLCEADPDACYYEWCNSDKLKSSRILSTQVHKNRVACAKFSHDGKYIISAGNDMIIKILESHSGREVLHLKAHRGEITWLANCFEPNSRKEAILSSSADSTVMVWRIPSDIIKADTKKAEILYAPWTIFDGHSTKVVSCCILNDGVTAASMGQNGEIKVWKILWDLKLCSEFASWKAHCASFEIGQCDLMPDGSKLVSTARTFLKMWDLSKKLPEWELEERDSQFVSCCFATNSREALVLATLDYRVNVYTVDGGRRLFSLLEPNRVPLLHCAISGNIIAASTNGQSVIVWNKESREVLDYHHGHKGCVCSVSFFPNLTTENNNIPAEETDLEIVSAGNDGTVMVWKSSPSNELDEVILREVFSCQFDSNNEPLIAGVDVNNKIKVYNGQQNLLAGENGSLIPSFRVTCCALSHKRNKVLYGCTTGSLKLFDIRSCTTKTLYNSKYESKSGFASEVTCCCLTKDDKIMIAGHDDGEIYIWRNDIIWTNGHDAHVTCLKLFNNDLYLATGSYDNTLKVWNVSNGALMFTCTGHTDSVVCCDISPDSKLITSASTDKTLMIWDACSGKALGKCIGHEGCVRVCAFAPYGTLLASGDDSGIVKLWPTDTGLLDCTTHENEHVHSGNKLFPLKIIEPLNSISFGKCNIWIYDLAFSADGSKFVICSDVIQSWSLCGANEKRVNPRLLQTFPIRGSKARYIFCSKNFESFVTIDDTGVLYHLKLIAHVNKEMLVENIESMN